MKIYYYLTYHAIERIQERFGFLCAQHPQLKQWKRGDDIKVAKDVIDIFVRESEENKSYLNNTNHMVYLYETYGFTTTFKMLEHKEAGMVMVMCKIPDKDMWRMVTVTPTSYRHIATNTKYNRTERSEVKKAKQLDSWYKTLNPLAEQQITFATKNIELENTLVTSVLDERAELIEHVSKTQNVYRVVIKGQAYEFVHNAGQDANRISIRNIEATDDADSVAPIMKHGDIIIDRTLQSQLDDKLKYALSAAAFHGDAEKVYQSNVMHWRYAFDGKEYEYTRTTRKQTLHITLLKVTELEEENNRATGG